MEHIQSNSCRLHKNCFNSLNSSTNTNEKEKKKQIEDGKKLLLRMATESNKFYATDIKLFESYIAPESNQQMHENHSWISIWLFFFGVCECLIVFYYFLCLFYSSSVNRIFVCYLFLNGVSLSWCFISHSYAIDFAIESSAKKNQKIFFRLLDFSSLF